MASINKALLVGRLSKDVEFRTTPNGNSVCDFNIAVDANQPTNNGTQERAAYFFKVTAWSKNAEFCQKFLKKGDLVGVDGSLVQRTYENKDGIKVTTVDINANKVTLLSHKTDKATEDNPASGFVPDADHSSSGPETTDTAVSEAENEEENKDDSDFDISDNMPW